MLSELKNLRILRLTGTRVTDEAIASLAQLTSLEELFLRWTDVTEAGAAELKKQLPDCQIHHLARPDPTGA